MNSYSKDLYTADDFALMVDDWRFNAAPEMDDVVLDGDPYYDDDYGIWQQYAHDDKCDYVLVADAEGCIYIEYLSTR